MSTGCVCPVKIPKTNLERVINPQTNYFNIEVILD